MDLYADLPGAYCGAGPGRDGPNRCCRGRSDTCSEPVSGTICYCDDFCHRNTSSDCCPDYWNVCLGLTPAPTAAPLRQAGASTVIQFTIVDDDVRFEGWEGWCRLPRLGRCCIEGE